MVPPTKVLGGIIILSEKDLARHVENKDEYDSYFRIKVFNLKVLKLSQS